MRRTSSAPSVRLRWTRALLAAGFALALAILGAAPASAHATLVAADPIPGTSLPQAPGAVVLHFIVAIDHLRRNVTVTGPRRSDATAGPAEAVPNDGRALR